jgi:hypothetical protein
MKKILVAVLLGLGLVGGAAGATGIGIGVFGGASVPVVNDISGNGSAFGVRVPVSLIPMVTVEPFYASTNLGDVDEDFGGISYTRDGGKTTGFGANALFTFGGPGFQFFPFVGIGSYKIERDGSEDITDMGLNFGLGLGISPIPKFGINLRGELNSVITDETSQKAANVTLGASYNLFP